MLLERMGKYIFCLFRLSDENKVEEDLKNVDLNNRLFSFYFAKVGLVVSYKI